MNELVVGNDYGKAYGLESAKLIYDGGIEWRVVDDAKGIDCGFRGEDINAKVLAYLSEQENAKALKMIQDVTDGARSFTVGTLVTMPIVFVKD